MISLNRAMLCVNCELISETERDCGACGSKQLIAVAPIIGGSLLTRKTEEATKSGSLAPNNKPSELTPELRAVAEKGEAVRQFCAMALQAPTEESRALENLADSFQRQIVPVERQPFNSCLNLILQLLRKYGIESASELLRILRKEKETKWFKPLKQNAACKHSEIRLFDWRRVGQELKLFEDRRRECRVRARHGWRWWQIRGRGSYYGNGISSRLRIRIVFNTAPCLGTRAHFQKGMGSKRGKACAESARFGEEAQAGERRFRQVDQSGDQ
jgi:hypothetical protein